MLFRSEGRGQWLPRWNFAENRSRLVGLRNAVEGGHLLPLAELVSMHAGQVVDQPPDQIEAFYAQGWAFARFLWEAEGGRHRATLRRILTEAANGTLFPGPTSRRTEDGLWDPESAQPLLEHYLHTDLAKLEVPFKRYMRRLAFQGYRPIEG